ncbi:MAG: phage integrase N-terminal SAM-like domain-containing protein [Gammaproteobacteria bacterium]|nr:phage integrase N-terminal SAM-like domain-containing protein [Gammaproteobacteria bacterium]
MDFNRCHSTTSPSRHSPCSEQNISIRHFNINWNLFRNTLIKKKLSQKPHYWYTLRAERFLAYLAKHHVSEISDTHLIKYLQPVLNDSCLKEWQVRQVIGSIQILCLDVLDGERFASVPWDDFFTGAQALSPDHPTLAREVVLNETGNSDIPLAVTRLDFGQMHAGDIPGRKHDQPAAVPSRGAAGR